MEVHTDAGAQGTPDEHAIVVEDVSKFFEAQADHCDTFKKRFVRGRSRQGKRMFHTLDGVSFRIHKGTTFGLIGHSDSGKSTVLKILAGAYRPTSSSISVSDKIDVLLELGARFHAKLTDRENIFLNSAILGRTKKQIEETLDWIIDFTDIGDFIDQPVKVYSSGMTVRPGFAVAMAIRPKILIVDEIIAVGDKEFQRKYFDYMRELRDAGTTVAFVTHSLSLTQKMCGEVVWLNHGHVKMITDADKTVSACLKAVNTREFAERATERQEEEEFPEDESFKLNQGNGDCRVIGIELLGAKSSRAPSLTPDEAGTIRVHVRARKDLHDIELGLAFMTGQSQTIIGPNSYHSGWFYSLRRGEETFIGYAMNLVLIQPGRF